MNDLRYMPLFVFLSGLLSSGMCFSADNHPGNAEPSPGSPLSVSGEVKEVRLHKNEAAGEMVIDVFMTVHFKNHSSSPLLVFVSKDWPCQGGQTLASSRQDAVSKKYVYVSGAWRSSDKPAWEDTRRKLDQKSPPPDLIRLIGPDAELSFEKTVVLGVEIKGSFDETSKPWDVIKKTDPLWLQLNFMLWPNNLEQNGLNPKFGRRLQRRWKDQGQLIIGNIISEPIPLSLPAT
jgi:hypothetical protein